VLIDEAWLQENSDVDPRHAHFADLRVDDVEASNLREKPLDQFIDGFYCDQCNKAFVSEVGLKQVRRYYYGTRRF
jgi:hypothetical protein